LNAYCKRVAGSRICCTGETTNIDEHRHSAIRFVTPSQRHAEQDKDLLAGCAAVYEMARQTHPQRWSKQCRNWRRVDQVHLNPDTPRTEEAETLKKAA
jgi:hypothetical protein